MLPRRGWLILALLQLLSAVLSSPQCLTCDFLTETVVKGLKITERNHFAGGDTAWEEKNLGKYATSETRLIEALEGVCKKSTLASTDSYISVKDLEFKCAHLMEESEELVEKWYYKNQETPIRDWLCVNELKVCCPKGKYGKNCESCPGISEGAAACFGHGKCDGDGTRAGTGKCACDNGYAGLLCRQCENNYYFKEKEENRVDCAECYGGCNGCTGPLATECTECRVGFERDSKNACVDVDECAKPELHACTKANEVCINDIGSYKCDCADGYKKNDVTKECELNILVTTEPPPEPVEDGNDEL